MKHFVSSIQENMHGLLEHMFVDYANLLRSKYPNKTIRNAAVFTSGVPEFARFGYIELIDARKGIPEEIPDFLVRTVKRSSVSRSGCQVPTFLMSHSTCTIR
jgi:hypothetical protein